MSINFKPNFQITPRIANSLMRIEAVKQQAASLPLTPTVLAHLRETAKLYTTHYSTMIEGNQLSAEQVRTVIKHKGHFPGRQRDEHEVKGYYAALAQLEQYAAKGTPITEKVIQILHALVVNNGRTTVTPTSYRDGQNIIKDSSTGAIVYLPPEAKDVPRLMRELVSWIKKRDELPAPLIAGLAHYQCATIHPYYDGNGRTARLLTTLILHLHGYDLKGLYSLEEYYAKNLRAYYQAITIGPSHNYYLGRAQADITPWLEYFCQGVAIAFENVVTQMTHAQTRGKKDYSTILRSLDPKQRKALELFNQYEVITSKRLADLFGFKQRTASQLCKQWVEIGFIEVAEIARKKRTYRLAPAYHPLRNA